MRSDNLDSPARSCDAVKLSHERHHVRNMLNHVAADDFVKLIFWKWVWHCAEVMNYVSLSARIGVDADSPRIFVLATADIEDLSGEGFGSQRCCFGGTHRKA